MKVKRGYACRKVAEQNIVIPTGQAEGETTVIVHLNDTGKFLWDMMAQESSVESLISALSEEYDVDENVVSEDVNSFLDTLRKANLIEE